MASTQLSHLSTLLSPAKAIPSVTAVWQSPELLLEIYAQAWKNTPQLPFLNRTSLNILRSTRQFRVAKYLRDSKNETDALTKASAAGYLQMVSEVTLLCGPFTRWDYSIALFFAAGTGAIDVANFLLDNDADINYDFAFPGVLREAARNGQVEMVNFLLLRGEIHQVQKNNALVKAAETGSTEIARLLLESDADPNFLCARAISAAAHGGHADLIRMLLRSGADIDMNNRQALYEASRMGFLDIVEMLLETTGRQSDLNAALGWSVTHGHRHIVARLLETGADVQFMSEHGVYGAAVSGHTEILRMLLERGANLMSQGGQSLLAASARGHVGVIRLLLEHGVDIHVLEDEALFLAASKSHIDVVRTLLAHGASVKDGGNRALPFAAANRSFDILFLLFDHGALILEEYNQPLLDTNYYYRYDVMAILLRAHDEWTSRNSVNEQLMSPLIEV